MFSIVVGPAPTHCPLIKLSVMKQT